jgi:hypothetical protein
MRPEEENKLKTKLDYMDHIIFHRRIETKQCHTKLFQGRIEINI